MMYFKKKLSIIYRDYGSFGYITDNRNFGYKQLNSNGKNIGDKIVSQSGAIFFNALGREPQSIEFLAKKISEEFLDVDIETIMSDAIEFYRILELDGFIVSGNTIQECSEKDLGFSYEDMEINSNKESCSINKELKDTQEFFNQYFNNTPQLTNLHIEITSKCNERCIHCYIPHENKITTMKPKLFYSILEQCKEMNVLHITITGGEPMIHEEFINFLRKCNEYNFSINVLSNLTLLNKDIIEEMKRNYLLSVQVSLYSMDPSIHDKITQQKGSFEKTKNAILALVDNNIPLQISCPIMKQNLDCYNDVIEWGKKLNINVGSDFILIGRYNHTTQNLYNRLSISDVQKVLEQKIANDTKYLESMEKEIEKKKDMKPDDYICSVCHSAICISENGIVYPCAGWQDYILGDLNEKRLNDIWKNSSKIEYLRNLRRKDFKKCIQCQQKEFCTMCMVRNANENTDGNPLEINEYFCDIVKLNKEMVIGYKHNCINCQG